ncbi:hypothetical protein IC620_01175 [Hazenella sp. IB182357]|uniref:Uncharacterized protein n=1 Tax=Polycladospora coralii TaxID=2771432 RepID=A0A926NCB8_9BACL|nr:hypothetical protein [Polycladospora coralii]MBD1370974.1 hypothetical protein [Polycladospora coralii]MBS7529913.1 hypothetical protein [Polycladospora coralii]
MIDTKKGKYSEEENTYIIDTINQSMQAGLRERDTIKGIADKLNRGYAGVMSHIRKLKLERPDLFLKQTDKDRSNSWDDSEEKVVIEIVNQYLNENRPLAEAIREIEDKLQRTSGAIYQRIYTLRKKSPNLFSKLPSQRPRRKRTIPDWEINPPTIRSIDEAYQQVNAELEHSFLENNPELSPNLEISLEQKMVLKAFEDRYGKPNTIAQDKLLNLMRVFGCTRVTIALFTLPTDKTFPNVITDFLELHLQNRNFL